ncbi:MULTISPECIES: glycosyltransferase [unclassified Schaalia]|uniref:glycosyltransferase n=1 Tax=unclassified Schaalia TaxID=2691889 RepID=UPI001E33BB9D|nr:MULTISPECIES: glycosyltransferase [unclassified Schaalia]MCD4550323.1 glycosyltransferase [Schaalia sp. lx-260]MCD4557771.1 glycosyltransferase [Schaalia sp. lx-100]
MFLPADHTFAVCAYGESPFLGECIQSLRAQTVGTNIVVVTSTPSQYIESVCAQFACPVVVNEGEAGIAGDWNFAVRTAGTPLVTIAHQDDVYRPHYAEEALRMLNQAEQPLLYFTDYGELREGHEVLDNRLLRVKRFLLRGLKNPAHAARKGVRRRALSLGCSICCPSVTLVTSVFEQPLFRSDFRSNLDWQAWEYLSRLDGSFVYNPQVLMLHRIHEDSETSKLIQDQSRRAEDLAMLKKFWPEPLARIINVAYAKGQDSNAS